MFSFTRFLFPKPPRHASPAGSGRTRRVISPAKTADTMTQRPPTDYSDSGPLRHVPTGPDGHSAVIRSIGSAPKPEGPLGCDDATVTNAIVVEVVDPFNWYPDLYDHGNPPSLLGTFDNPEDQTPRNLRAMRSGLPAALGNSALTHQTRPSDEWFRAELADAARDNSLREFHRRTSAWLQNGTTAAPRHDVGYVLDTSVFATVAQSGFDTTLVTPIGVSR